MITGVLTIVSLLLYYVLGAIGTIIILFVAIYPPKFTILLLVKKIMLIHLMMDIVIGQKEMGIILKAIRTITKMS